MHWLSRNVGSAGAQIVAGLLAFAVLGLLGYLARAERRDRLRVLGSLAFYAAAAVGLSAVSANMSGARAAAVATFAEEAGEALGAVVFLIAVLVGVAPRLVLPAEWALRRSADAHTLDAAGRVSEGRPAAGWR
jgi:ACR3 family arsenite efflux pump ArsB